MFAIKRKEAVARAVQRSARERLERMLGELSGERVDRRRVAADARRLLALLALVSGGMDRLAVQRERRVLRSVIRRVEAGLEVGPALSEVRMRSGYWHVAAGGGSDAEWEVLGLGLRSAYGRARRRVLNGESGTAEVLGALRELADQCRWLERMWPGVLGAQRARLMALVKSGEEVEPGKSSAWREALGREAGALFGETPGFFVKRHGGYWGAWRGGGCEAGA